MVVDGDQVREVLLGEQGVAAGRGAPGRCASTCRRSRRRRRGRSAPSSRERGIALLDAPVTGSSPKAQDGTLTIMAGGDAEDFARAEPLLRGHGRARRPRRRARARARWSSSSTTPSRPPTRRRVGEALLVGQAHRRRPRRARAGHGQGLGRLGDARPQGRRRCATTTTRRSSSSSTCSRTCACASRRARPPACRSRPPRAPATCSSPRWRADTPTTTSRRSSRRSRRSPAPA